MNPEISTAGYGSPRIAPLMSAGWRFGPVGEADTVSVQHFIRVKFREAYDADIRMFFPDLLALHHGDRLMAACGVRHAEREPLFLERYLDYAVERLLPGDRNFTADRTGIVEIGNLSIARPGASRQLIAHLTAHLHARDVEWTVFTAVPALRNNFMRLGIRLYALRSADVSRIPVEEREAWGRYYQQRPVVCAVRVRDAHAALSL